MLMKSAAKTLVATLLLAVMITPSWAQPAPTRIRFSLDWLFQGPAAFFLLPLAKGYFKEEGLDVTVDTGNGSAGVLTRVAAGSHDMALADVSAFTEFLGQNPASPQAQLQGIFTLYDASPAAVVTLKRSGITKPRDFEGKNIGGPISDAGRKAFPLFARANGLDMSKIKVETVLANAEPLLIGKVDYFTGMLNNQTYQVELEAGKPNAPANLKGKVWKVIKFADYGVPFYHDVIYATGSKIKTNPDLVRRFLSAVAKGLNYTVENPDDAVKLVAAYPEQVEDAAKLAWRMKIQNPLAVSATTRQKGILWMEPATWDAGMAFYKEYDQIPRVVPAAEVMTNEFNPKITSK